MTHMQRNASKGYMGRARQRGPVLGCRGKQSENKLVRDKPGNPIQDHVT